MNNLNKKIYLISHGLFLIILLLYSVNDYYITVGRISRIFFQISGYLHLLMYIFIPLTMSIIISVSARCANIKISPIQVLIFSWFGAIISAVVVIFTKYSDVFRIPLPDSMIGSFVLISALCTYVFCFLMLSIVLKK